MNGKKWMFHSLKECNYLKTHPQNHLVFQYRKNEEETMITIQEQYQTKKSRDTNFEDIYKVLIKQLTLPELLVLQGVFSCSTQSQMAILIEE